MRFSSITAAAALLLAPHLTAAAPSEPAIQREVRRHVLERRACPYDNNLQCQNDQAGACVRCSLEPIKESLTCLNSCFADAATFCAELC